MPRYGRDALAGTGLRLLDIYCKDDLAMTSYSESSQRQGPGVDRQRHWLRLIQGCHPGCEGSRPQARLQTNAKNARQQLGVLAQLIGSNVLLFLAGDRAEHSVDKFSEMSVYVKASSD